MTFEPGESETLVNRFEPERSLVAQGGKAMSPMSGSAGPGALNSTTFEPQSVGMSSRRWPPRSRRFSRFAERNSLRMLPENQTPDSRRGFVATLPWSSVIWTLIWRVQAYAFL